MSLAGVDVDVVIGEGHAHRGSIEAVCAARGFACSVQPPHLANLMAGADLAIGAGGITTWERCCLGLPAIALVVAENQRRQVLDAAEAGLVYAPDVAEGTPPAAVIARHVLALLENPALRQAMSAAGMRHVDGRGTVRVLQALGIDGLDIREARPGDSDDVLAWRNDPSVRHSSRSQDPIHPACHRAWFEAVLADPQRLLLIGSRAEIPVGVVRFDIEGDEAEVSIYLAAGPAEPGSGGALLQAAEQWLAAARPDLVRVRAHVLGPNARSHRLFLGTGYEMEFSWYFKRLRRP
jgi:RimJ/RimL family protein N-acetyltransferase